MNDLYRHRALSALALIALSVAAVADEPLVPVSGAPDVRHYPLHVSRTLSSGRLKVSVGLKGFDQQKISDFILSQQNPASPNFHHWITTAEFGRRFGPSDSDVAVVKKYLESQGIQNVQVDPARAFIWGVTTFGGAGKAFHTELVNYVRPQELVDKGEPATFFGPSGVVQVPASVASKIYGVCGLCNLALGHPNYRATKAAKTKKQGQQGYVPSNFAVAYNSAPLQKQVTALNRLQKIAIFSPTLRLPKDVATFWTQVMGQKYSPIVYDIYPSGLVPGYSPDGAGEAALDQETVLGQDPTAAVLMFEPDAFASTDQEFMVAEEIGYSAVGIFGATPVLTSSWDLEEHQVIAEGSQSYATTFENICASLAAEGVSIFVASGDSAAYSAGGASVITTKMESSCPYVTSVGGTHLVVNSNSTWNSEPLWSYNGSTTRPEGGSGGISALYPRPSWQVGPGVITGYSTGKRQIPDVSADGDITPGYEIYANGAFESVGGTSASTPLWAANITLMEALYSKILHPTGPTVPEFLGLLNPNLYALGSLFENPAQDYPENQMFYVYHDIVSGNNGRYPTTAQYDLCSGWGSADFYKMYLDLGMLAAIPGFGPDFKPYNPGAVSGIGTFTSPVMLSASSTTLSVPSKITHGVKYYLWLPRANTGTSDGPSCLTGIALNGKLLTTFPVAALNPNTWDLWIIPVTFSAAGTATVEEVVNFEGKTKELNTANNSIVVHFTVN